MNHEVLTPARLIQAAAKQIPVADAEFLLMTILGHNRHEIYLCETDAPANAITYFHNSVIKAKQGTPVQYLVHDAPFLDFSVWVDERVLIPRPETEELVTRATKKINDPSLIIDFGTGSGCIAIALARCFPKARIMAVDVSQNALEVARINIMKHGVSGQITLKHASSLSDPIFAGFKGKINLLISNPPYIPARRLPGLDTKVRNHEPRISLDGGPKGIKILQMLIKKGPELLAINGLLALEIDSDQTCLLKRIAPKANIEKDLADMPRYLFLRKADQ
ncbi:protein-(glutamine-N5) methyltransferase, release factor-specific [candidate division WOR-3 bacterium JGI_Cruoil_03_51_56]|uniref:peptide chain release factor N(5)-glutamine methyltransferase n=1 Tax=candidate division WOR-3 bacterium JGI_Cruoil_03_51_56 TaxID=1973747 RepID=A0A235BV69_UNCW3|nr:MAG: protein-(glutamine-N5) methyltransferase, release factor-specific [candidate division WOR-3 bacterium JGI_Cruoil_03_51_56]